MKSQANGLLKVAVGVLKDYSLSYPHDKRNVARDIERLTRLVEKRGIGVFLLDLPALDSALTKALESGRLIVDGALSKRVSSSIQVPKLFRGLWLRIFDRVGNLIEEADPTVVFFLRQLCCTGKKVEVECSDARTKAVLKEYYNVERDARTPTLSWCDDDLGFDDACSFDDLIDRTTTSRGCEQLDFWRQPNDRSEHRQHQALLRRLQQNCDVFARAIGKFEIEEFVSTIRIHADGIGFRHGPGAVSDLTKKENKYDFPNWSEKLGRTFPYELYGSLSVRARLNYCSARYPSPRQAELELPRAGARPPSVRNLRRYALPSRRLAIQYGGRGTVTAGIKPPGPNSGCNDNLRHADCLVSETLLYDLEECRRPSAHEAYSRLLAVPKTAKGPRLIAAEPVAHQWCQQLILRYFEERLSGLFGGNFIDLRAQEKSQLLVRSSSLVRDLATVDLSSASDRLSCWVVERAFRSNKTLLEALHATRTRWVKDCVDKTQPPNYFIPKKFASQGTAVTFPVQSIIFLLIALTASGFLAYKEEDFLCSNGICNSVGRFRNKVRVFGDDIIVPVQGYDRLVYLLHALGLKVNQDKSFVKGHFRESCGADYFKGINVTPIKTTKLDSTGPTLRQSLIDYSNNLHQAGLWNAAAVVTSMIPAWVRKNLAVIGISDGGVGLCSFTGTQRDHLRKRWNPRYQRTEYSQYGVVSRVRRMRTNTLSGVLQYITEAPSPLTKWEHGLPGRPKTSDGVRWESPY